MTFSEELSNTWFLSAKKGLVTEKLSLLRHVEVAKVEGRPSPIPIIKSRHSEEQGSQIHDPEK